MRRQANATYLNTYGGGSGTAQGLTSVTSTATYPAAVHVADYPTRRRARCTG